MSIGVSNAKEIEVDVEDVDIVVEAYEAAIANGDNLFWVTDSDGMRHGIVAANVAFLQVEAADRRSKVGFQAE